MAYDNEAALKETLKGQAHTITITPPSASILIESDSTTMLDSGGGLKPQAYIFPMLIDSAHSTPSDSRSMCETPDSGDPWDTVVHTHPAAPQWRDLTLKGKCHRTAVNASKALWLIMLLYFFICSLDLLSTGFRLVGSRAVGRFFADSALLANPVVGLMIGVMVTVLVQSSSTSTSIVVTMVASRIIQVRQAIPIVMGANIGTSITNTIVSLMQSTDRNQFRRAFAAATVHDIFNWLTVIVLLPLEVSCRYLETLTTWLVKGSDEYHQDKSVKREFLNKFTKPFTKRIIRIDKKLLEKLATNHTEELDARLLIQCCPANKKCLPDCKESLFGYIGWSDTITGVVLVILSVVVLCTCLVMLVKLLNSLLTGHIAKLIKRTMNRDYVFPYSVLVDYLAILAGCILTILVQSSSIFTSALTPLAGIGVISLERMYPLTLGSNIGTTTTGLLAALAADSSRIQDTLQLALCHLFFNLTGMLLFYPVPCMRFPIPVARMLGNITAKYRWFSVVYLLSMFLVFPLLVFSLSLLGTAAMLSVIVPLILLGATVIGVNLMQAYHPAWLPLWLRNWHFLPLWMRSLDPIDVIITRLTNSKLFFCCGSECCANGTNGEHHHIHRGHDGPRLGHHEDTHQSQLHILGSMYKSNSETNFYEKATNKANEKKKKKKTVFKIGKKSPLRYENNNGREHHNRLMSVVVGHGFEHDTDDDDDDDDWAGFNSHTVHNCFDVHRYYPASPIFMHKIEESKKEEADELDDTDL